MWNGAHDLFTKPREIASYIICEVKLQMNPEGQGFATLCLPPNPADLSVERWPTNIMWTSGCERSSNMPRLCNCLCQHSPTILNPLIMEALMEWEMISQDSELITLLQLICISNLYASPYIQGRCPRSSCTSCEKLQHVPKTSTKAHRCQT